MPDSDVTVDVTYTAKDYTVTYESNGGSTVPSQTVKYNETANKPADPTRAATPSLAGTPRRSSPTSTTLLLP